MYVVIAGGGVVGLGLARKLSDRRHDVVVVEIDREVCEEIYSRYGIVAVRGSATDIEALESAGIQKAEVALGVTPNDADNLAFTVLAKHAGVPRVMVRMRNPRYEEAYRRAGADEVINIAELYVDQLLLFVEQPKLKQVATFGGGKAAIVVLQLPEDCPRDGATIAEIAASPDFPHECVISGMYRESTKEFIIPRGDRRIHSGDQLFLAAGTEEIRQAASFFNLTEKLR